MAKPTPQQQAVIDAIAGGEQHVVVTARAGSGKTTTAIECARHGRGRVGMVAFNKHIAEELQNKGKLLLQAIRPEQCFRRSSGALFAVPQGKAALDLAGYAKGALLDYDRDGPQAFAVLAEHHGLDLLNDPEDIIDTTAELLEAMRADTARWDFDDQIWLPVVLGLPVPRYDLLLVDEAQDLDRAKQALAMRASEGGRLVPIGDDRQAINGFAGADPDAFPRLAEALGGSSRGAFLRPLTVTWRCPTSGVALAQRLVPDLLPAPNAIEGIVRSAGEDEPLHTLVGPGDMVLSRRNAPLLTAAFSLLAKDVPCLVRGRDVGKGLLALVDELKSNTPVELLDELETWAGAERARAEKKDAPESVLQSIEDRRLCVRELASRCSTMANLREVLGRLFSDAGADGKVVLSSIHRAKGLEANRVVIIDTKGLPLTLACRYCRGSGMWPDQRGEGRRCPKCKGRGTRAQPWQHQQELNLLYVAITRFKRELIFHGPTPSILTGGF